MNLFRALLVSTVIVRGMGAGIIYDVAVIGLDTRKEIGLFPYAHFARALFERRGKKNYVPISIGGALLTILIAVFALFYHVPQRSCLWIWIALFSTCWAFVGTSQALPAIAKVRHSAEDKEAELEAALNCFARWHIFSTIWQVASFVALTIALAYD